MESFGVTSNLLEAVSSAVIRLQARVRKLLSYDARILMLMLLLSTSAIGQVDRGQIAGTVTDDSGAVVPGATVMATNLASNSHRSVQSSATGSYILVGLEPGTYQLSASASQFKPFSAKVEVTVGGHITLDAKLSVNGNVTEVQVVA